MYRTLVSTHLRGLLPGVLSSSRAPPRRPVNFVPVHEWEFNAPANIQLRHLHTDRVPLGRFLGPAPQLPQLVDPYVIAQRPNGERWEARRSLIYKSCTLITPTLSVENVAVWEWYNPETQETVTAGPSCGVFIATDSRAKKHYAYDAWILYTGKRNIIDKGSSISREWQDLIETYKLQSEELKLPVPAPSLPQFAAHYHRFIQSQVCTHMHNLLLLVQYTFFSVW